MDAVTYPHPSVRAELERWIAQKIDASEAPALARLCGVAAVPIALALAGDGRILDHREGFVEPAEFANWLQRTRAGAVPARATPPR
jgi:hypothetical protein